MVRGAAAVLAQDRLLALAPRRARALPLVAGMVAQLVPQLLRRSHDVRASLAACTAAGPRPGARDALTRDVVTAALLVARGVARARRLHACPRLESGRPRTTYRPERLRRRDAAALVGIAVLLALAVACAWGLCAQWRFYPAHERARSLVGLRAVRTSRVPSRRVELVVRLRERGRR